MRLATHLFVQVEVMLFGGQKEAASKNLTTKASRSINRLKLSYNVATSNYTFDGWKDENMTMGRVMPDAVMLPNGKVVILNGANVRRFANRVKIVYVIVHLP